MPLLGQYFTISSFPVFFLKNLLILVLLNPDIPCFANRVDPDLKKPTDLDLHCLPSSMQIYSNNVDQVTRLAEN